MAERVCWWDERIPEYVRDWQSSSVKRLIRMYIEATVMSCVKHPCVDREQVGEWKGRKECLEFVIGEIFDMSSFCDQCKREIEIEGIGK